MMHQECLNPNDAPGISELVGFYEQFFQIVVVLRQKRVLIFSELGTFKLP